MLPEWKAIWCCLFFKKKIRWSPQEMHRLGVFVCVCAWMCASVCSAFSFSVAVNHSLLLLYSICACGYIWCWCAFVYTHSTNKQPSPLHSCCWINIVDLLIERGARRGPELYLLWRAREHTHTRARTGIGFISYNHLHIILADPSCMRHQGDLVCAATRHRRGHACETLKLTKNEGQKNPPKKNQKKPHHFTANVMNMQRC